jgi:hypothetical protein
VFPNIYQLLGLLSGGTLIGETVLIPAAQLRVFTHICVCIYVYSYNITYVHLQVYVYIRATPLRRPVCQAALLLPGLVLTPLIPESVRPAAAGFCV